MKRWLKKHTVLFYQKINDPYERNGFGLVKSKCEMMGVWLRLHLCFGYFGGFLGYFVLVGLILLVSPFPLCNIYAKRLSKLNEVVKTATCLTNPHNKQSKAQIFRRLEGSALPSGIPKSYLMNSSWHPFFWADFWKITWNKNKYGRRSRTLAFSREFSFRSKFFGESLNNKT